MRKSTIALLIAFGISIVGFAQSVIITGNVHNSTNQVPVTSVSVIAKGTSFGTFTDASGNFKLTVDNLPVVLVFTSVNFETKEVPVTSATSPVQVDFNPVIQLGQEVV